jgi:hypothetical protein
VLCRLPGIEAEMISVSCKIPPSLYHSIHCGGVLRGVSRDHRRWVKQASASKDQLTDEFADRSTLELSGVPDLIKKRSRHSHIKIFVFLFRHGTSLV